MCAQHACWRLEAEICTAFITHSAPSAPTTAHLADLALRCMQHVDVEKCHCCITCAWRNTLALLCWASCSLDWIHEPVVPVNTTQGMLPGAQTLEAHGITLLAPEASVPVDCLALAAGDAAHQTVAVSNTHAIWACTGTALDSGAQPIDLEACSIIHDRQAQSSSSSGSRAAAGIHAVSWSPTAPQDACGSVRAHAATRLLAYAHGTTLEVVAMYAPGHAVGAAAAQPAGHVDLGRMEASPQPSSWRCMSWHGAEAGLLAAICQVCRAAAS